MKRFDVRNLHAWMVFKATDGLPVEVYSEYREALIRVMADKPIRLYAQIEGMARMCIAVGEGLLEAAITVADDAIVSWESDHKDASVWLLPMVGSQLWEDEDGDGSFAVVEPRGPVEDENYRRMMVLMQHNMQKRLQQQIDAIAEQDNPIIEDLKVQLEETKKKVADLQKPSGGEE